MSDVRLTKRVEFSASHRYHNPAWDAARNRAVFGLCNNASGHGHNYLLEVTVAGPVSRDTGMVVNLYDLKEVLIDALTEFDHKHLNLDTPYFATRIPTTENIAGVLWTVLARRREIGRLELVRLYEDEDLYADVTAEDFDGVDLRRARVVRRYPFSAAHRLAARHHSLDSSISRPGCGQSGLHGHNYVLDVAVAGALNPETGMVIDLGLLDQTVREVVLNRVEGCDLNEVVPTSTGERLVSWMWGMLLPRLQNRLDRVRLTESVDSFYEVTAR